MSFQSHIGSIVSIAGRQRVGVLCRGFILDKYHLKKVFLSLIYAHSQYNSNKWNPTRVHFIELLESVQQGLTKRIKAIPKLLCIERLGIFNQSKTSRIM